MRSEMDSLPLDRLPQGTRMKVLRIVAGLSADGMAARWGRSRAYVYRIESGERDPTPLEARDSMQLAETAIAESTIAEADAAASAAGALRADAPGEDSDENGGGAPPRRPSS